MATIPIHEWTKGVLLYLFPDAFLAKTEERRRDREHGDKGTTGCKRGAHDADALNLRNLDAKGVTTRRQLTVERTDSKRAVKLGAGKNQQPATPIDSVKIGNTPWICWPLYTGNNHPRTTSQKGEIETQRGTKISPGKSKSGHSSTTADAECPLPSNEKITAERWADFNATTAKDTRPVGLPGG
jgi:hypothetical protein